jgi:dTDP-4-dehydrorhamnose reductase
LNVIWLVGRNGMLGSEVMRSLQASGRAYVGTDREVDITRPEAIEKYLDALRPARLEWVINCAAYTNVELAEKERDSAYALNAEGPRHLAGAARKAGAALVHLSTDYIFNGSKATDYGEEDAADPVNVYGRTKLDGELAVRGALEKHYIIRTAWLYGRAGKNFVETMLRLLQGQDTVRVVKDQIGNPTYAVDLAQAIMAVISDTRGRYGTYNFTNEGEASWHSFAKAILREAMSVGLVNKQVEIMPITADEYPAKVRRPQRTCLSKEKIKREFGLTIRGWREALRSYLEARALPAALPGSRPI